MKATVPDAMMRSTSGSCGSAYTGVSKAVTTAKLSPLSTHCGSTSAGVNVIVGDCPPPPQPADTVTVLITSFPCNFALISQSPTSSGVKPTYGCTRFTLFPIGF